ncbi:MAG TPA: PVC-type heme-binding CxxCH protein [Candidatus Saccharimonadales bacterium]|nr:PVC-type heme-binding CxxCH protein [Candidatus Saccharimonadales bacterium]
MHKFVFGLLLVSLSAPLARAHPKFELQEGDRVVLVGDTLIEREQESGWLETAMAAGFDDRHFTVRNLGWSADTPAGESRASFDFTDPTKGFSLLKQEIATAKPTVVVIGYGMASSFSGEAGLAKFKTDLNRLIDTVQGASAQPVRFVILSPLRHEKLPAPLPNPARHNAQLVLYTEALRDIAARRGFPFVDLFDWKPSGRIQAFTANGIHPTPEGYRLLALEVARQLGWKLSLTKAGSKTIEALRQTVIHKDQLFFDRWRPQNETYLFGFRKHEQGQNAHEIPEFDPLVKEAEESIARFQELLQRGIKVPPPAEPAPMTAVKPIVAQPTPDFEVAPGFEVKLWAEDPLLAKPIQMNFDPQGRLWVASSALYPQIAPGQTADDKIVILEDTTGAGKANKSTIFAEGLFIPQGIEPGDGGCYVGQSTELLHFTDTHGTGKADQRRVVLSGFGTEDTHHMVHTLAWGPDGMLYFDQSGYIHSHIETPNGVVRLNSGGVFHLRPSTMQLDVFLRGFCNPWGHQFDAFGQSFVTDGAGYEGVSWGIRDATYFFYASMRREMQSISPGQYPKFCGLEIVASQQFPDDWQGDFVTADFRAHRIVRFSVSDEGAGYVTKQMPDLVVSTNITFRPVDLKFGPDGALYVADWSNPIINHGEVDFRDPRRDHEHGRIWRITAKGRPLTPRINLTKVPTPELFNELLSSNLYDVQQSRRVLTERGKAVEKPLKKWTARQTDPKALLEALWMYQAIGVRNDRLLDQLLQVPDGRIRAAAVRVLSYWPRTYLAHSGPDKGRPVPAECYERALADPFPRVRVEAVRAVALIPSLRSAELALDLLNQKMDPFLDYALWLTVNDLAQPWLEGLRTGAWSTEGREKELNFALNAIEPELAGPVLGEMFKKQPLTLDGHGPWIELIGRSGSSEDVEHLYQKLLARGFDAAASTRALAALNAASARSVKPKSDLDKVVGFFDSPDPATRVEAIRLAGNWGGPGNSLSLITALAKAQDTPSPVSAAAFAALKKIGGPETIQILHSLTGKEEAPEIRQSAVLDLAALDSAHSGADAISLLSGLTNETAALPVWRALLSDAGMAPVLAAALPHNGFPNASGVAGVRAVRESGRSEPALIVALTRAAGLEGKESTLTSAEIAKLGEAVLKRGKAARGERVFRRPQQSCTTCHSIGGIGGKVGPDLTSIGASSPLDYLIESVLYPNKEIKDGFHSYLIETTDGEELSGIPVRENDRELVMRTAADQEITVQKSQIKSRRIGGSLMPSGLVDNLTEQEQLDLYRFLTELGKPGPFDAAKANVARLWAVSRDATPTAVELTGKDWHRATSLTDGRLLREDVEGAVASDKSPPLSTILAGTSFRNGTAGLVRFDLSAPAGTAAWIDGQPVEQLSPMTAQLPAGVHTIILKLEAKDLPPFIRLRSDDGTFLGK